MSELLGLSFDSDASPSLVFGPEGQPGLVPAPQPTVYGWGVGWYPRSERGASVVKDPTSAGETSVSSVLSDWGRFRSTLFVCHLRGHARQRSQEDTQPFVRSYGGRQWIFAHDGDLAPDYVQRLALDDDPACEALGNTDSEHAFCWLLTRMRASNARALSEVPAEDLRAWLSEINLGGRANLMLSDGDLLAVYGDASQQGQVCWTRRIPPHATTRLESDAVRIELDAPEDPNRTALIFSSIPLSQDLWLRLAPSQLLLARRGSIIWDSHPDESGIRNAGVPGPVVPPPRVEAGHQLSAAQPMAPPNAPQRYAESVLTVTHETHYQYETPVQRSSHRLLLRPVDDRMQRVEDFQLLIDPPGNARDFDDVFGNSAVALEIEQPYGELLIRSSARVRVYPLAPVGSRGGQRQTIPLVWMPWQRQMLSAYLLPLELPETQLEELSEFAMSFVERNGSDLVGTLLDMNDTLYRDFEYVSGSTNVATTPFEVFESRRGVCQDFANLMICLARLLNVPARYRMGYIHTGADYANKVQSDASHAWVELYVPRDGWHGFDPTNGIEAGADHIRVACGRQYRDATPTSGTIYRGGGTETLRVSVRVERAS